MRQEKSADVGDAANLWRMHIQKNVREINANPFSVNVRNGIYNVMDTGSPGGGSIKPHKPEY